MAKAHGSLLFSAPLEIRHRIYQQLLGAETHLFFDKGQLQMVPCQGTDDESHRKPGGGTPCDFDDPVWIRRVESSWGCHWKCEEVYLNSVEGDDQISHMPLLPLLLTSKTMYLDIVQFFSHPTQYVHFTDLETIDFLVSATTSSVAPGTSDKNRWSIIRSVHNIGFTLRASMRLLGTLYVPFFSTPRMQREINTPPRPFGTPEGSGCLRQYEQWKRLWPSLQDLPSLQSFSLWLDHSGHYTWDLVYEREILQSLTDVMPILNSRGVEVCVNLPRLPLEKTSYHNDDRYFVTEASTFSVKRRVRLPWKCAGNGYEHMWAEADEGGLWWVTNEENGEIPPGYPENRVTSRGEDWLIFDAMGYDVDSEEFYNHPQLGFPMKGEWGII